MADLNFFKRSGPFTLGEIAAFSGCTLGEGVDPQYIVEDVAPLDSAGTTDLAFLDNRKYKDNFLKTKAGACILRPDMAAFAPPAVQVLLSPNPYKSYALAAQKFYPENRQQAGISPHAHIDPTAHIGADCRVEAGAVIAAGAVIGQGVWVEAHAVIGENVQIGDFCRIGVHASVSHCLMGAHTRLYPGVRIGQDGFGFAIDPKGHVKVPQLGRVIIGSHVEIGANSTIDRGAGPDTVIGDGTWIDNLVQIGHNAKIGRGCILVSQSGISGSTVLEDFVAVGGQAGIAGHLHIGRGARIAAQSGVMRDVPAGVEIMGSPALPIKENMRQVAVLKRLTKKE